LVRKEERRETEENTMPDLATMIEEILEVAEDICTEWEYEFMESVEEQFKERGTLSDKQIDILEGIYEKACKSPY
jgi:hypothetical protein